jgi:glycosyltransferase involved in cell wall biosynthesis
LKVVYITSSFPYGAGEGFLIAEVRSLTERGLKIAVCPILGRGPRIHSFVAATVPGSQALLSLQIMTSFLGKVAREPRKLLRVLPYLVRGLGRGSWIRTVLVFPKAVWLADVCSRSGIQHLHAFWCSTAATIAMIASELSGIPWSMSCHRADLVEGHLMREKFDRALFVRFISERGIKMSKISDVQQRKKAAIIHVGVDVPKQVNTKSRSPRVLLCPANMVPVKGHRYLLDACALLSASFRDFVLVLAGDGPLRSEIEDYVRELNISDRVQFLGALPHSRIVEMYSKAEVFATVLPSIDLGNGQHEGIPVALMEAMAHGVPVISTRSGSIPELVRPGCGLLVEAGSAQALAEAIRALLEDEALCRILAVNGRRTVDERFNAQEIAAALELLFCGIPPHVIPRKHAGKDEFSRHSFALLPGDSSYLYATNDSSTQ